MVKNSDVLLKLDEVKKEPNDNNSDKVCSYIIVTLFYNVAKVRES